MKVAEEVAPRASASTIILYRKSVERSRLVISIDVAPEAVVYDFKAHPIPLVPPLGPVGPVGPVTPAGPVGPVAPVAHAPVAPVAPAGPVGPVGHVGHTSSTPAGHTPPAFGQNNVLVFVFK